MPVVINEFEIVEEPPAAGGTAAPLQPAEETKPALAAPEVERIMQHLAERELRLWAH